MISILKKVREAISASRGPETSVNEDSGILVISACASAHALDLWQSVADEGCDWLHAKFIDDTDDHIAPLESIPDQRLRICLDFRASPTNPYILTEEGWRAFLYDDARVIAAETVRLLFLDAAFATMAFPVLPWLEQPESLPLITTETFLRGPRRQVRCTSPDLLAPTKIEPWILKGSASEISTGLAVWRAVSAVMIGRSLASELFKEEGAATISLLGQPIRKLRFGDFNDNNVGFELLQEAATWVYLDSPDVEVRHTFLTSELAREWNGDTPYLSGLTLRLAGALSSARLLYKAHLRTGSKDTLKALADLRKTLAEEVQKLLQQSRDLSAAVWRDVGVAIGVAAVRVALDGIKITGAKPEFAIVYLLIALYIGVSYGITIATNERFLRIVDDSRLAFRSKLYGFLDDADYSILASEPIASALQAYKSTRRKTTAVVFITVLLLIVGFYLELGLIALK